MMLLVVYDYYGVGELLLKIRGRGLDLAVFDLFRRPSVEPLQSKVLKATEATSVAWAGYRATKATILGRFGTVLGPFWDHFDRFETVFKRF